MKRYFLVFVTLNTLLFAAAFGFTVHMVVSLVAVIFNLFVHCIVFTYLLGTGKWVKEVAMAYSLDPEGWPAQAKSFKVRVNRLLLLAMATSIGAALTGAGAQTQPQSWWTLAHPVFAVLIWFVNGWAFWVEYQVILANEVVLRDVKAAADRMRDEAGTLD